MSIKIRNISILLTLFMAAFLCVFLSYRKRSDIDSFTRFSQTEKTMDIDHFLAKADGYTILQTEIYYVPFYVNVNAPLSEHELLNTIPYVKVIGSRLASYPRTIADLLDKHQFKKIQGVNADFRYSCLMYSKSGEVIRFSISSLGADLLYVNGQSYNVSYEIIDAFLKLLPAVDYEQAIKDFEFEDTD